MTSSVYNPGQIYLIQSTTDYGSFKLDPTNRSIDSDHLERLYNAISQKNLLREFPILVRPDGTILDGQHRWKVAESLGVPLYYIVTDGMTTEDVPNTNALVSKWSAQDWLEVWCKKGNPDYLALANFMRQYPFLKLSIAVNLCTYGDRTDMTTAFKNGTYRCNDLDFAHEVANAILDFAPYVVFYKDSRFIYAVSVLFEHEEYNHQRMMQKMAYMSRKIVKCPDLPTYMEMFTDIYNYKTREEGKVRFEKITSSSPKRRKDRMRRLVKEQAGVKA